MKPFSLAVGALSVLVLGQKAYAEGSDLEKITSKVFFDVNIDDKSAGEDALLEDLYGVVF
jgi:hypothetical protein